jgi:four helix bundle protein
MAIVTNYQELLVWKKSMFWVEQIYLVSRTFPSEERFGLTSQLRRASVSVVANIAEGAARTGPREFLQFLSISRGSLAEAETLLTLSHRLGMTSQSEMRGLLDLSAEISRMLGALQRSLHARC